MDNQIKAALRGDKQAQFGAEQIEVMKRLRDMEDRDKQRSAKKVKISVCPCCGSSAHHYNRFDRHTIECPNCGLQTPIKNSMEKCLEIWNTRV